MKQWTKTLIFRKIYNVSNYQRKNLLSFHGKNLKIKLVNVLWNHIQLSVQYVAFSDIMVTLVAYNKVMESRKKLLYISYEYSTVSNSPRYTSELNLTLAFYIAKSFSMATGSWLSKMWLFHFRRWKVKDNSILTYMKKVLWFN